MLAGNSYDEEIMSLSDDGIRTGIKSNFHDYFGDNIHGNILPKQATLPQLGDMVAIKMESDSDVGHTTYNYGNRLYANTVDIVRTSQESDKLGTSLKSCNVGGVTIKAEDDNELVDVPFTAPSEHDLSEESGHLHTHNAGLGQAGGTTIANDLMFGLGDYLSEPVPDDGNIIAEISSDSANVYYSICDSDTQEKATQTDDGVNKKYVTTKRAKHAATQTWPTREDRSATRVSKLLKKRPFSEGKNWILCNFLLKYGTLCH